MEGNAAQAAKPKKSEAVLECEKIYPATTKEFKKILGEQYELFCKKQVNYGPENISVGTKLSTPDEVRVSLTGIWFRVNDKVQRLKQLILLSKKDMVGESIDDSFVDMSVYGIIAQIVSRGKWAQ